MLWLIQLRKGTIHTFLFMLVKFYKSGTKFSIQYLNQSLVTNQRIFEIQRVAIAAVWPLCFGSIVDFCAKFIKGPEKATKVILLPFAVSFAVVTILLICSLIGFESPIVMWIFFAVMSFGVTVFMGQGLGMKLIQ